MTGVVVVVPLTHYARHRHSLVELYEFVERLGDLALDPGGMVVDDLHGKVGVEMRDDFRRHLLAQLDDGRLIHLRRPRQQI